MKPFVLDYASTFKKLVGNEEIKQEFSLLIQQGTFPQVVLFYGPQGVGKTAFAKAITEVLLQIADWIHPDVYHLMPDGKVEQHTMASVQDFIDQTHFPPALATKRMFIIHKADKMSDVCMNALLKTLEEPKEGIYFVLLCDEISNLLPTILSRCNMIHFKPLSSETIAHYLQREKKISQDEADTVAKLSQGSLSRASEIVTKRNHLAFASLQDLLEKQLNKGIAFWQEQILQIENSLEEERKEKAGEANLLYVETLPDTAKGLIEQLMLFFRDIALIQMADRVGEKELNVSEIIYHKEKKELLISIAQRLPPLSLLKIHDVLFEMVGALSVHIRFRHALEATLLALST